MKYVTSCVSASAKSLSSNFRITPQFMKPSTALARHDPPILYSHPNWLFNHWKKLFGTHETIALMDWNNQPAQTHYRLNPLNPPTEEKESPTPEDVTAGHYYITDPSTRHAIELLKPQPGEHILDACAAPGGKAIAIAGLMENKGQLLCTDSNPKRLPRLINGMSASTPSS